MKRFLWFIFVGAVLSTALNISMQMHSHIESVWEYVVSLMMGAPFWVLVWIAIENDGSIKWK